MNKIIFGLCLISVVGCSSAPIGAFVDVAPGCKSSLVSINNQQVTTNFCIKAIAFKPSQYLVTVNDQLVFDGTDYTRVGFESSIQEGIAIGGCDEIVKIQDTGTQKTLKLADLPSELVSECHISADSSGYSLPFKKDVACDKAFYKSLAPMLGKVFPVETSRQCSVKLGGRTLFDDNFTF